MLRVVSKFQRLTRMHKRVILLKLVVGVMLLYVHFFPQNPHVGLVANLFWLVAF
jgi:hypothetical protein